MDKKINLKKMVLYLTVSAAWCYVRVSYGTEPNLNFFNIPAAAWPQDAAPSCCAGPQRNQI